ncbi:ABC transporter ATP-binding protein [Leifsonia bigeumensis]|uniref:ABC transporter ATP-binding protein n=1 Tax=Leifsonella bigeumensis TaxID=433643 RepID=A0ABP7FFT9_9MICO
MSELLVVDDLTVTFLERGKPKNRPLRGISLTIGEGEILGVVGETGCGKTLTGLAVLGLLPQGAQPNGRIVLDGVEQDFTKPSADTRGRIVSLVFQNPGTAFNPVFTIGAQMRDVIRRHRGLRRGEAREHILHYLAEVGLPDPDRVYRSFPHELSGGMLQRAMIAMALLCEPRLLVLDEPTTALDVTIAKQILQLIRRLRDQFGFGVLFITHNLGVVNELCDRLAVLYAGRVVESGPTAEVLQDPQHPYTRGLLNALPSRQTPGSPLEAIPGAVPGNLLAVTACAFADRCRYAIAACREIDPLLEELSAGHGVACIRAGEI